MRVKRQDAASTFILQERVDRGGELFGRLEDEGVAAFGKGHPGERNLPGDDAGIR